MYDRVFTNVRMLERIPREGCFDGEYFKGHQSAVMTSRESEWDELRPQACSTTHHNALQRAQGQTVSAPADHSHTLPQPHIHSHTICTATRHMKTDPEHDLEIKLTRPADLQL